MFGNIKFIVAVVGAVVLFNVLSFMLWVFVLSPDDSGDVDTDGSQKTEQVANTKPVSVVEGEAKEEPEPEPDPEVVSANLEKEFYAILFTYGDAITMCMDEVKSRNSNLIVANFNELSSRYVEKEQHYLIKIDSQVGTPMQYDEKQHACHIDPKERAIDFYQEIIKRTAVRPMG